jgi:hypothetical protein
VDEDGFRGPLEQVLRQRGRFGHSEHLELAWLYVQRAELGTAEAWMQCAIKHIAAAHGTPGKYHETLTLMWARVVAAHARLSDARDFEMFIGENPTLLDRSLPSHHFSDPLLWSDQARRQWVEPDLAPFPQWTS